MPNIAIITARGGSKRIPRKNIKEFCGHPIIYYSIKAALGSGLFDEVMVSTDDTEIAEIARSFGASVPFMRSEETSNDYATTADVLTEVLTQYKSTGRQFDVMCCIYPTAPFVTGDKLRKCFWLMRNQNADSSLSVTRFSFPPQRAFVIRDGRVEYQYPEFAKARSQDLEPIYHDCGQFYFYNAESFLTGKFIGRAVPFIVPEEEVQDIDTLSDWKIAEMKFMAINL